MDSRGVMRAIFIYVSANPCQELKIAQFFSPMFRLPLIRAPALLLARLGFKACWHRGGRCESCANREP
jgi:hypothetical protein